MVKISKTSRKPPGVTLTELLCSLTILAILVAACIVMLPNTTKKANKYLKDEAARKTKIVNMAEGSDTR